MEDATAAGSPVATTITTETLGELARELADVRRRQKEFKTENKEIFLENKSFNKELSAAKRALAEAMAEIGLTTFSCDEIEIEIKTRQSQKHDMDLLREKFGDEAKVDDYVSSITSDKEEVACRKRRRAKDSE